MPQVDYDRLARQLRGVAVDEAEFQEWYARAAKKQGLNPDPDHPLHFYDYRAAFAAGARPDLGHWPSKFKLEGHPRLVVDGIDTRTGKPASTAPVVAFPRNPQEAAMLMRVSPASAPPVSFPKNPTEAAAAMRAPKASDAPKAIDYDQLARQFGGVEGPSESLEAPESAQGEGGYRHPLASFGAGVMKGAVNTAIGVGGLFRSLGSSLTGGAIDPETAAFQAARAEVQPRPGTAETGGFAAEQIGEFFIPSGAALKGAKVVQAGARAAVNAGLARAQGASETGAAVAGGMSLVPAGPAVAAVGRFVGSKAEPLVRAAIKPTVAAMRRIAGSSVTGLDAQAERLARFIIDNRLTTPDKAQAIITNAEQELRRVLWIQNAPTDAPQRALRYLQALENNAAKQGLPAADVKILRNAAEEVLESGLGRDVVSLVPGRGAGSIGGLKPVVTGRAPRSDVMADEALERARASSKWTTRKAWGEMKGAEMEAAKAVERGLRDSVKAAVPLAKPLLQKQGEAIRAKEVLDRASFRAANRDAASLPAHVIAAGEIASGRAPMLAFAANWLRNNQLKAGIWADDLAKAIKRNDVPRVADLLQQLARGSDRSASVRRGEPVSQ